MKIVVTFDRTDRADLVAAALRRVADVIDIGILDDEFTLASPVGDVHVERVSGGGT